MLEFVKSEGNTILKGKTIYKKARPTIVRKDKPQDMDPKEFKQVEADHNA
jgi:hypothetical protein